MKKLFTVLAIDANNSPAIPWSSGYSEDKNEAIDAFYNEQLDNLCFDDDPIAGNERKKEFSQFVSSMRISEIGTLYQFETLRFSLELMNPIKAVQS